MYRKPLTRYQILWKRFPGQRLIHKSALRPRGRPWHLSETGSSSRAKRSCLDVRSKPESRALDGRIPTGPRFRETAIL